MGQFSLVVVRLPILYTETTKIYLTYLNFMRISVKAFDLNSEKDPRNGRHSKWERSKNPHTYVTQTCTKYVYPNVLKTSRCVWPQLSEIHQTYTQTKCRKLVKTETSLRSIKIINVEKYVPGSGIVYLQNCWSLRKRRFHCSLYGRCCM